MVYSYTMVKENRSRVVEECYFRLGDGGFTLKVVEHEVFTYSKTHTRYDMGITLSHYGSESTSTFPLGSMEVVAWLHEMTGRLLEDMATKNDGACAYAFQDHQAGTIKVEGGKEAHTTFRWKGNTMVRTPNVYSSHDAVADITLLFLKGQDVARWSPHVLEDDKRFSLGQNENGDIVTVMIKGLNTIQASEWANHPLRKRIPAFFDREIYRRIPHSQGGVTTFEGGLTD